MYINLIYCDLIAGPAASRCGRGTARRGRVSGARFPATPFETKIESRGTTTSHPREIGPDIERDECMDKCEKKAVSCMSIYRGPRVPVLLTVPLHAAVRCWTRTCSRHCYIRIGSSIVVVVAEDCPTSGLQGIDQSAASDGLLNLNCG